MWVRCAARWLSSRLGRSGVSDEFVRLVVGLSPPGAERRYHIESAVPLRDRFLLFVLAWLADGDGECSVSKSELAAYTLLRPAQVLEVRARLVAAGVLEVSRVVGSSLPASYRLRRDVLVARQMVGVVREGGSVYVLEEFGLGRISIGPLVRCGVGDMVTLAEEVARFRALPLAVQGRGFHVFLVDGRGARHFGAQGGRRVLEAFDRWRADTMG